MEEKVSNDLNNTIETRKEKLSSFLKTDFKSYMQYIILFVIIIIAIYIRTANLDSVIPDALPTDPDSALFYRYAKIIAETGELPKIDTMRYVPLGFDTYSESRLFPYVLAYIYKFFSLFNSNITLLRVDMLYPIIMMPFILIAFFLLVRKIFEWKVALLASAFLAVIPPFLQRTMLGFSDKEPLGIFFFFLSFYFLVSGFKAESLSGAVIYGILSGIFTGLLGLTWGGVDFAFLIIAFTFIAMILLGNFKKKDFSLYLSWIILTTAILKIFSTRYPVLAIVTSPILSLIYFPFFLFLISFFLNKKFGGKSKFPLTIISLVITFVIGLLFAVLVNGFSFISYLFSEIQLKLLHPFGLERLTLTVAENSQPFISTWMGNFGWLFWIMLLGAIILFYTAFLNANFNKKRLYKLTAVFILFLFGLIFSRFDSNSILNGTNIVSRLIYFGGMILILAFILYVYLKMFYKDKDSFEKFSHLDPALLLTLFWFVWTAIGARGAIRLVFLFTPIVTILSALFIVKISELSNLFKDKILKFSTIVIVILIAGALLYTSTVFSYNNAKGQFPNLHPQWTNAMNWVRGNTPENAVFAHWWDYGYWVQTGGERATVLDGGNVYPYWDHLMGRHVLTGQGEQEALEFLFTHNSTHFLIDSSDIGKYPAYSSIGSDENYDRYSFIQFFSLQEQAIQETRNATIYVYQGGVPLDQDFIWQGQLFAAEKAGIGAFLIPILGSGNEIAVSQPRAILVNQGKQVEVPIKCIYVETLEKSFEFSDEGLGGCIYLFPKIKQEDGGSINNFGTAAYLSEKNVNALWVQLYFFNKKSDSFKLEHVEEDLVVNELRRQLEPQGQKIPSIIDFNGLRAPIKIWGINYPQNIKANPEYLETEFPNKNLTVTR